jgi:hypothetical protein
VTEEQRTDKMRSAIEDVVVRLMEMRRCDRRDALHAIADDYRENLRDAAGTAEESYWRAMLAIAQELLIAEGQPSLMEGSA